MKRIAGMFANLPTALSRDGARIDAGIMRERIDWLVDAGIHGFSTQLSAGEFAYLTLDERRSLTQLVLEAVNGRAPVLVGISGNSAAESIALARHAGQLGATAAMLMPRSYFKLTEDEVVAYFESVGSQSGCPLGIYNNPVTTGVDISAALYARIQGVCNVVATKDGGGDIFRVSEVRARCPRTMAYLCGTEFQSLPALVLGADGCCNAINSVVPREVVALYDAILSGDLGAARAQFDKLHPLFAFIRVHGVARTTKATADLLGISFGPHRAPLQALSAAAIARLSQALREAGLLVDATAPTAFAAAG
jgi:4-hydroxy-tetrahydrodipicolinate synthase